MRVRSNIIGLEVMKHEISFESARPNTPNWVKNAIFYQIFPDRFAKNLSKLQACFQSAAFEDWNSRPTHYGYKGGNLWGVLDRLDYLKSLGINAIYFNPIFQSPTNHRYGTHDYYQIDPLLGGQKAFRELLKAAHEIGIRIVLDGVFNHSGRGFFYFNDVLENGPQSPWVDWFDIKAWPLSPYPANAKEARLYPANYAAWENYRSLPQFNHGNPAVREYIMKLGEHWINEGIDGWRLDAPHYIQAPGFWEEFRSRIKAINSEAYIVGEILANAPPETLNGSRFDGITDYSFRKLVIAFVYGRRVCHKYLTRWAEESYNQIDADEYAKTIDQLLASSPWEIQLANLNFLSNHDTARLISLTNEDFAGLELATILLITFPGAPCIYYGEEIALRGGTDPDCRRGFPPENEWNRQVLDYYRALIALRHRYPTLRIGRYQTLFAQVNVYVFARMLENEIVIVAVNIGMETMETTIDNTQLPNFMHYDQNPRQCVILYGYGEARWVDLHDSFALKLLLPPRSGLLIDSSI